MRYRGTDNMVAPVMKRATAIEYHNLSLHPEFSLDLVYRYLTQFVNIASLCPCSLNFTLKSRDILLWKLFEKFLVDEWEKVRPVILVLKTQFQLLGKFLVELNATIFSNKDPL